MATKTVEILNPTARTIAGISKKNQKEYSFRVQEAYLHSGTAYPEKFEVTLDDDARPYAAGMYSFGSDSIYINRQGRLDISARLIPQENKLAAAK